jgi:hypothetical protein
MTAIGNIFDRPLLAGFCLSLVGLKFPRSGHCLSGGVATTTGNFRVESPRSLVMAAYPCAARSYGRRPIMVNDRYPLWNAVSGILLGRLWSNTLAKLGVMVEDRYPLWNPLWNPLAGH